MKSKEGSMKNRMILLCGVLAMALVPIMGPGTVLGQDSFPSKPVTIIVPFGPGGIIDVGTRIFVNSLSK